MKRPVLLIVFSWIISSIVAQSHWESMVIESDIWRYLAATSEPPANWMQTDFNASAWKLGQGGLGYGDNDDFTIVPACNSLYIRKQIILPDVNIVEDLILDIDYDDAFVLYINGVECARSSNVNGAFPPYNATLTRDREATMYQGGSPERHQLKPSNLVRGVNTFAVQIINQSINSSDLSARVFIHAKINYSSKLYHDTPSWFKEPVHFGQSNFPIIFIDTKGQTIPKDYKITVDMKVLDSNTGLNLITDSVYAYDGHLAMKIRGFSSATFPKNNYTVETRTPTGQNLNVLLLGLPPENDWVFHGPYSDKSLMRNVLAYHLGNLTGKWSPRTRFFEMYMNGNYHGLYVLAEKIKIDRFRLDLSQLKSTDVSGDAITGGYILQIDRPETGQVDGKDYWISPYRARTALQQRVFFIHMDPDGDELNAAQRSYIRNHITNFEHAMNSDQYKDRVQGYLPYIDLQSFVDYYIITELSRNLDGYRISTYLHKDRDSKGGKISMGPYWDYNICFGNANFFSAGNPEGWVIDGMGDADAYAMPFWWEKFRLDPFFNSHLKKRWTYWSERYMNETYLNQFIDSIALSLREAQARNFQRWDVLGRYVWPNNYIGQSHTDEVNYLKRWLRDRINWMDSQIQPIIDITADIHTINWQMLDLVTFPNPFTEEVKFKFLLNEPGDIQINLMDLYGRVLMQYSETVVDGIHEIPIVLDTNVFPDQVFIYQFLVDGVVRKTGKLLR